MPPPIAETKSAGAWGKQAVESTIRAWYNVMAIESGELKQVKEEWEARFAALPDDTNASLIDPALQLHWRELPRRSSQDGTGGTRPENQTDTRRRAAPLDGVSLALENPPINPLTGRGRTSADVARDTLTWHAYVRAQADGLEAVFQGDYLFTHPPNQTLQLHRVASGAFIEDATSPTISFQTAEYIQTPNPLIGGFWGEFTMKPNPYYNPANKKMGGIYIRHNEITREHIKLYGVAVVIVKKPPPAPGQKPVTYVRVLAASLTRLAKVCPEFAVPKLLPPSHADDDVSSAADSVPLPPDDEDEDDPPPPIPDGYQQVPAASLRSVADFLIWSRVGTAQGMWHVGVVTRVYAANYRYRGRPYTHDAKLDGQNEVRGVNLTPQLEADGLWVALQRITAPVAAPVPAPARAGHRAR